MSDRSIKEQITRVVAGLTAPVQVLMPEDMLPSGEVICRKVPRTNVRVCLPKGTAGAEDILSLVCAAAAPAAAVTSMDVYQQLLLGELSEIEIEDAAARFRLPRRLERCVLVFRLRKAAAESARDVLESIIPMQDADVLVDIDPCTAALIKDMTGEDTADEILQFAQAMQDTLANDTDCETDIGIGSFCTELSELGESFRQASEAVRLGSIFRQGEDIHSYQGLVLERMLSDIPPQVRDKYSALLAEQLEDRHFFNEDMLYTIDMFFKCDLNIAETSRRLYAHRNTLIYRLNSIQRLTGLDLRSFRDAMIFKMLMDLGKCGKE